MDEESKFTESQIVAVLEEREAGAPVADLVRKHGISPGTCYNWKSKYAWVAVSELKRMYAELALETRRSRMS